MRRLVLLVLAVMLLFGSGCYSASEKTKIRNREEFIKQCNEELTRQGFTDSKLTTIGPAATTVKFQVGPGPNADSSSFYYGKVLLIWDDEEGYCELGPMLKERGFKKWVSKTTSGTFTIDLTTEEFKHGQGNPEE